MSLASILADAKSKLTALLTFANEKTGAADTSIGDAIKTLADGYGQGGGTLVETGTFTTTGTPKTVTINHSLGVKPNLIIAYPIDVTLTTTYTNSFEIVLDGFGQSNYVKGTTATNVNKTISNDPFIMGYGTGYSLSAPTVNSLSSEAFKKTYYSADENHVTFGGINEATGSGKFSNGTYGYIIAKI